MSWLTFKSTFGADGGNAFRSDGRYFGCPFRLSESPSFSHHSVPFLGRPAGFKAHQLTRMHRVMIDALLEDRPGPDPVLVRPIGPQIFGAS
ncbi:unnamed protein product [Linum trigynum]|uniref:Uncharacterized protein n=1 Tax=Linum trigynum TaxID=586398 RepID=A0AAV2DIK0_9ROSI